MRHHVTNVDPAGSIVDGRGQTVLVSTNVEDRELADGIRMRVRLAHVHKVGPAQSLRDPIPVIKRYLCVPVSVGEFATLALKMRALCQSVERNHVLHRFKRLRNVSTGIGLSRFAWIIRWQLAHTTARSLGLVITGVCSLLSCLR